MIHDLRPYPAYKDSGVSWLGKMPANWEMVPALAAYRQKQTKNVGMKETTVLSLSYGSIVVKPEEKLRGLVPESFETYQIIEPGNIVIRTTDLQNDKTSLRIGITRNRGIITAAYMCLQVTDRLLDDFGYQFLNTYDLLKIIYGYGSGLRQTLEFNDIKRMPVLVPSKPEQSAIVRFLDYLDRRIRRYIAAKQKLIKLLEEQKQAIIHRAVTRGLDPNVRLKPSGVEWLGDVPEHWEVSRAKHLFQEVDNRTPTGTETLLSLRMYRGLVPHIEVSDAPVTSEALIGYKNIAIGQLVMNRMRAAIGMFGVATRPGLVSPDYAIFQPRAKVNAEYYLKLFKTRAAGAVFRIESKGLGTGSSGFMRLYTDRFGIIGMPVPPEEEQCSIVEWISAATREAVRTQEQVAREISLLNEYRTRLIADIVTGKLDVREAAANLPDEVAHEPEETSVIEESAEDIDEELESAIEEVDADN